MKVCEPILLPNVYHASTSIHLQPLANIKHNMFQIHVSSKGFLPKVLMTRFTKQDKLGKHG